MSLRTVLVGVMAVGPVFASCAPPPPPGTKRVPDRADTSKAVFVGVVKRVVPVATGLPIVTLQVVERFLGAASEEFELRLTSDYFINGVPQQIPAMVEGQTWFVEAHFNSALKHWTTSHCERTRLAERAGEELRLFREWVAAGVIAYTHARDGEAPWPAQDVFTVREDGTEVRRLTSDGRSFNPSWSPDGKRVLFISEVKQRPVELSVMDADGRNRRVLRVIEPVIYSAAWSPDGRFIAVSALQGSRMGLYLLPASGEGELRPVAESGWQPSWSPDGKKLAFSVERPRGRWAIHTANVDGSGDVALTGVGMNGAPAWSPDGKLIAFQRSFSMDSRDQVFVMSYDGTNMRQLTSDPGWSCGHPTWSREGKRLVVACRAAGSCNSGIASSTGQVLPWCKRRLFVVDIEGGAMRKVVESDASFPVYAPQSQ